MNEQEIKLPGTLREGLSVTGKGYEPGTVLDYTAYLPVAAAQAHPVRAHRHRTGTGPFRNLPVVAPAGQQIHAQPP